MPVRDDYVYLDPVRRHGARDEFEAVVSAATSMSETRSRDEIVQQYLQRILEQLMAPSLLTARRAMASGS